MNIIETDRLMLGKFTLYDAPFILDLVNDPDWLRFIGDRGVTTLEDARHYLKEGYIKHYEEFGYGLFAVKLKKDETPIGVCGFLKRDYLDDYDIGFAFLPAFRGMGYAFEATSAVITHGREILGLERVAAIVQVDNCRSIRLLEKLGLKFERMLELPDDDAEIKLYGMPI